VPRIIQIDRRFQGGVGADKEGGLLVKHRYVNKRGGVGSALGWGMHIAGKESHATEYISKRQKTSIN